MLYIILAVLLLVAYLCWRIYFTYFTGIYRNSSSLKGKVFVVTGANSGIGLETTRELAKRQATIVMACRNKKLAEVAIEDIRKSTTFGEMIFCHLDLASFASVRKCAEEISQKFSKIDVLINNAGLGTPSNIRTEDGFEIHFGVNHLGHFLLTQLLLPKLIQSGPSRIVIVSSILHELGRLSLEDVKNYKRRFHYLFSYSDSKLANVCHGRELASRLKDSNVEVCIVCPGIVPTNGLRYTRWFELVLIFPVYLFMLEPLWKGVQNVIYAATEKNLPGASGSFYRYVKIYNSWKTFNPEVQKMLWEISEHLVKT